MASDELRYLNWGMRYIRWINYTNRTVDQICRLHDSSIKALVVTGGFCVTGSSDRCETVRQTKHFIPTTSPFTACYCSLEASWEAPSTTLVEIITHKRCNTWVSKREEYFSRRRILFFLKKSQWHAAFQKDEQKMRIPAEVWVAQQFSEAAQEFLTRHQRGGMLVQCFTSTGLP